MGWEYQFGEDTINTGKRRYVRREEWEKMRALRHDLAFLKKMRGLKFLN